MNTKEQTTKEVLAEAKQEVFDGKSTTVKNHFHTLLGKRDGISARLATTTKKIEAELATIEGEITKFSKLSVDDAYNEIVTSQTGNQTIAGQWHIMSTDGVYSTYTNR